MVCGWAKAEPLTVQQAQTVAEQFVQQNATRFASGKNALLKLAHEAKSASGIADYYVFNRGDNAGFVIVSGDDKAVPVLGMSDNGTFDANNIPANVAWWLEQYQEQIQYLRENPEAARTAPKLATSVSPLMTSTWKQSAPYNQEIPTFRFSLGTYRPVVGCVALAMAQMMRAHNWPTTGEGSHSYYCQPTGATGKTLTADFGNTTYQWSSMKDSYSSSADATAVGTLCYHAGVAVDMQYNTAENGGSGAQIYDAAVALKTYFRYDKGLDLYLRDFYTLDTWEQMLRDELDAGCPIVYGGSTVNMYGHCFVFDGYDTDGKFHINWGWGGEYDGYFVSSVLDSGRTNADFSNWQQAILGAKPDRTGTSTGSTRPLAGYLVNFSTTATQVALGSDAPLTIEGITFLGDGSYTQNYCGVQIVTDDEATVIDTQWQADCSSMAVGETYAIDETAALTVPSSIAEGVYRIYAVYSLDDAVTSVRYERPVEKASYIKMTVSGGIAYFSEGEVGPVVTTPVIAASPLTLAFTGAPGKTYTKTFTVSGQNLEGDITATLASEAQGVYSIDKTTITQAEATAGATITVTYSPATLGETAATVTLSSQNATDVVVNITGSAQDETPVITVDPASLAFSTTEGTTQSNTFTVAGNFIVGDVTLTLSGDDVYTVNPATIAASALADGTATVTVTFSPETAGNYTGTITLTSEGAQAKTVTLTGEAAAKPEPGTATATDPYLNLANYASIDDAGGMPTDMTALYKYTPNAAADSAWLTLAAYGTWQADANQNWYNIAASYSARTSWTAQDVFAGSEAYFSGTSRVIDSEATENFYVTNCTMVKALGHNYSAMTAVTMNIYECTDNNGTLVEGTTPVATVESDIYSAFLMESPQLDASKIYKVTFYAKNCEMFEFAFQTPIAAAPQFLPGDANEDGNVDVQDITTVINYILGNNPSPFNYNNANVNGDDAVNVVDVTAIINIILGVQ